MQVSHVDDHVTHAVIGGGQAIEATISQDASFFHMLSATLYSDQPLAVVREVICNAWDAHIEAGCKDKPIKITLQDNVLTVKDFGKGIHRDDIGFIYLNYGGSTKKHDGNQTGGFGLGCKAPWAYVDHFEVTSCHAGVKSIYRMVKSCPEANGKPSAKPIGSFKTDETGLTVTLQLKGRDDSRKFTELIRRIAFCGDIPVEFNGLIQETVGFDSTKSNFLLRMQEGMPNKFTNTRICVRYGNVVYPVVSTPEWSSECHQLTHHLDKFRYGFCLMFQAPPHSITVTPSREMLSMQGQTIDTLKKLAKDYLAQYDAPLADLGIKFIDDSIKLAVAEKSYPTLITRKNTPASPLIQKVAYHQLNTVDEMAELAIISRYPDTQRFRKGDITKRIRLMVQAGMLGRGLSQTFLCSLDKDGYKHDQWLTKRVLAPLMQGLKDKKIIGSLMVFDSDDENVDRYNRWKASYQPLVLASNSCQKSTMNSFPYLRNIIVITSVQKGIEQRVRPHEVFKKYGWAEGFLVFVTGGKKQEKEDALAYFKTTGMVVVDMTTHQHWEPEFNREVGERKKKADGVPCLSSIMGASGSINFKYSKGDNVPRIVKPEFILSISLAQGESTSCIHGATQGELRKLVGLYGTRGGVTNVASTLDKYIRDGAKPFTQWVADLVCDTMTKNPNVQKYYATSLRQADVDSLVPSNLTDLVEMCFTEPTLAKEYGIWADLTEEERFLVKLWDDSFAYRALGQTKCTVVKDHLEAIPRTKEVEAFYKMVENNHLLSIIDADALASAVTQKNATKAAEAVAFLKSILK